MRLIQRYSVLICILISVITMVIATLLYPGGSLFDKNSIGFDWSKNFFSNLFAANALNGEANPGRLWALVGMFFDSLGFGLFFIHSSKKMASKHAANVLKFVGTANIVFNFLIVTPLHDQMVTTSSTLTLIGLFYITIFMFKTKLHFLKFACIICLLIFYFTLFLYGSGDWGMLAIMQKVSFVSATLLILGIEYFTKWEDFNQAQKILN